MAIITPGGVLISCVVNDIEDAIQKGSGILFPNGLICVHGSIFTSLFHRQQLINNKWPEQFLQTITTNLNKSVYLEENVKFFMHNMYQGKIPLRMLGAWRCPMVDNSVQQLFSEWTIALPGDGNLMKMGDDSITWRKLMPVFIALHVETTIPDLNIPIKLNCPSRGDDVLVESSPFGSVALLNSISKGIVCNVMGEQNCIFVSDAQTFLGCEGGAVFTQRDQQLFGMIICSLNWWHGERTGWSIGIFLHPVLSRISSFNISKSISFDGHVLGNISVWDNAIVRIRCGPMWGSGVVINCIHSDAIILTNSHVLNHFDAGHTDVNVFYMNSRYKADVIYRTPKNMIYDIAVLAIHNPNFTQFTVPMDDGMQLTKGDMVIAAGFPVFSEFDLPNMKPTFTRGCVARSSSYLLQTTCTILPGASGGAIICRNKLAGLIVCSSRGESDVVYPTINFSIPVSVFRGQILDYVKTRDTTIFKSFKTDDIFIMREWLLQPSKL